MSALKSRIGIVTGGAGGIGRGAARALAGAGAHVVVADIDTLRGQETVDEIHATGGSATFVRTDVSDAEQVSHLVNGTVERHGRLDCAVNAAGIEFEATLLHDETEADYERMMDVNVRSIFLCLRAQLAVMVDQPGGGSIVAIASTNAHRPQPRTPLYSASKHAVLGLVRATALDYAAKGVRINAISPGAIDTPMLRGAIDRRGGNPADFARVLNPMRRFGDPTEVGQAALWLCSDASSFTTGTTLAVDGGFLAG
jgi:glucose 1-dehydrogenase